jgi:hypothetical protein
VNENVSLATVDGLAGWAVIVVSGGVVSTVHV